MSKLVSVVIPTYNSAAFLPDTISSVLSQTVSDWELIIVNDGSTDETEQLLKSYNDSRIRYVNRKNSGVSCSRNHGASLASGEYLAFLDSDDLWQPDNLSNKLKPLQEDSSIHFSYSDIQYIDINGNTLNTGEKALEENLLENILNWKGPVIPCPCSNVLMRKSVFGHGRILFDENLSTAADQDFAIHLTYKHRGTRVAEPLVLYRKRPNSMSTNISLMESDHIKVFEKARRKNLFINRNHKRESFANLYLILAGSWWVNGRNRKKGLYFLLKAFFTKPQTVISKLRRRVK